MRYGRIAGWGKAAPRKLWRAIPSRAKMRARVAIGALQIRAGTLLLPLYTRVTRR